ncbi:hypothetical protein B0H12DRAFT_1079726 [Mycena haematopus]|nr:hypothetical protein B0H12DRAFT_1079726 [Mycena haematopus]
MKSGEADMKSSLIEAADMKSSLSYIVGYRFARWSLSLVVVQRSLVAAASWRLHVRSSRLVRAKSVRTSLPWPANMAIDLLRHRDPRTSLGPFDGKVAALAHIGAEHYFITTHADYVPALPSLEVPHALFLRSDMRYGTDDPTLWPQKWTANYCHLAAIAKRGSRLDIAVMWWDPLRSDFIVGSTIMQGLGRLKSSQTSKFLPPINDLVDRCTKLRRTSATPISPLFGQLINNILLWMEQLQTLPTTYPKMVFAVTSLQRAFLELDALYEYMTKYKPRMDDYLHSIPRDTPVAHCIGAFTLVPSVAQQLWVARLPFWFMRPTHVFDEVNVLAVVSLLHPIFLAPDVPGDDTPPIVYSGNSTTEKIAVISRAAATTPWYRDPYEIMNICSVSPPPVASGSNAVASTSGRTSSAPLAQSRGPRNSSVPSLKPAKTAANKGTTAPVQTERDKFSALAVPGMPPSIAPWADALSKVDRSVPPLPSHAERYVLPEPALLVNSSPERCRKFLTHWTLLCDGFMYMLSSGEPQLLSGQEWRDILEGLLTKRGHTGSRTNQRSIALEDHIRPALEASNVTSINGFPVPLASLSDFSLEKTHEITASKKDRVDQVKYCFAGGMLLGAPLELSKCGWAATAIEERHRYVLRTATLMLDWTTTSPHPNIIGHVSVRRTGFGGGCLPLLHQAFWEYFGRAAVVPLRLDHDIEKEEGQL